MDYQEEKKQEPMDSGVDIIPTVDFTPSKELQSILLNGGSRLQATLTTSNQVDDDEDEELNNADLAIVRDILGRSLSGLDSSVMSLDDSRDFGSPPPRRGVSFSGIDSPASSKADDEKTIGELIAKIQSLQIKLEKANIDLSAEKSMRKKKERNLVKLAKELTKRSDEYAAKNKQIVKLVETCRGFEEKAAEKAKELEERNAMVEKISRERHKEITEAQQKYRNTCREHDSRMSDITKLHAMEMEGLRREVLSSKLEADRLRAKLARAEMKIAPDDAEKIVERTMRDSMVTPSSKSSGFGVAIFITILFVAAAAAGAGAIYKFKLTTVDSWCSPALPGTVLSDNISLEAPWWAPDPYKEKAFAVCGDRPRTRLVLNQGKLVATSSKLTNGKEEVLMTKRGSQFEIHADRVAVIDAKGRTQNFDSPWKL